MWYFIILLICKPSTCQKLLSTCTLFLLSSPLSLPCFFSFPSPIITASFYVYFPLILLTDDLIFTQNLGLVCLQSITLILEDDFDKQVTLSRGGQILTSPNQGFNLNGKKQ